MAGVGLGVSIVPQVTNFTIGAYGWRTAYLVLSALIKEKTPREAGSKLREEPSTQDGR
jgi:hypothetical protein